MLKPSINEVLNKINKFVRYNTKRFLSVDASFEKIIYNNASFPMRSSSERAGNVC